MTRLIFLSMSFRSLTQRHPRESGDPWRVVLRCQEVRWVPAFAGMTVMSKFSVTTG